MPNYSILCTHGIGHAEVNKDWNQPWIDVLKETFEKKLHSQYTLAFSALAYDNIFEKYPSNAAEDVEAVAELLGSAAYPLYLFFNQLLIETVGRPELAPEYGGQKHGCWAHYPE
jgi:hypothetical protein